MPRAVNPEKLKAVLRRTPEIKRMVGKHLSEADEDFPMDKDIAVLETAARELLTLRKLVERAEP